MRALSVRQPWAELIAQGKKKIEYRSWKRDWGTLKLFIDIQHVTWPLRENVEDADWNWDLQRETYVNGLPILPLIGLEYLTAK